MIRWLASCLMLAVVASSSNLQAQTPKRGTIEIDATSGTPITDVEIDGEAFRFALDPLLGPFVTINPSASERITVRSKKADAITAKIDGAEIKGSLGKVRIKVANRSQTVEAALIGRDHLPAGQSQPYDMAGGFEALPAHFVVVHFNRDLKGPMREITFIRNPSDKRPGFPIGIADTAMRINVHFANPTTWLDRRAAEPLIADGLLEPTGEVSKVPVWYGLRMPVQGLKPTKTITIKGIRINRLEVRTGEPLILPEPDENVILVQRTRPGQRAPAILLGMDTLKQCAKMVFDKRKRRLTFTCPR